MDNVILDNVNNCVSASDTLYFLGDFAFKVGSGKLKEYRERINCKNIHLILGNHDQKSKNQLRGLFTSVSNLKRIRIEKQDIILCHYAMKVWDKSHWGSYQLFGHSHNGLPDDPNQLQTDVGVDTNNFMPYPFEEIKEKMSKKTPKLIHHRK